MKWQLPAGADARSGFIRRYAIAVLVAAATVVVRIALVPILGARPPYITFYLGIVIAAAAAGMGPGLLVTFVGAVFGLILIASGPVEVQAEAVRTGIYLLSGIGTSLIAGAMHRNRQKLHAASRLPEENPHPVLRLGPDGQVLYGNPRAAALMQEEQRICHEPLPKTLCAAAASVLKRGAPREVQVQCAEGRIFSFYCVPLPKKRYVNLYGRDVTDLIRVQEELRRTKEANEESLARLEAVIRSMDEALVISDLNGNIHTLNPSALRLHGFADIEQARRHITEYPQLFDVTDLQGNPLPTEAWPMSRAIRGEAFSHQEIRVRRRDADLEFVGSYNGAPVRDRDGKVILAVVTIRDVTEQKRAEEALRESEEHARRIIDHTLSFVGVMTPDGTLIEANATALKAGGLKREEVMGKKFWDCYWWSYNPEVQAQLREAVARAASGEVVRYDVVVRMAGDSRMPIDFMLAPVRNSTGEITYLIPSGTDITERKRAEHELIEAKAAAEEANRAKSEFLAKMSHEIRTPMTVVIGSLEHVLETDPTPEQRPLLEMAASAAQRLLSILNDVLDIARIEARQVKIEAIPFDLRDCVGKAVDLFALSAGEKGLRLHWQVAREVPSRVVADPGRLTQVLVNLVGNAVKFTARGEVMVNVTQAQDGVVFTVRDTGIGIPRDKLDEIFEPFNQGDDSRTRQYGGTGLGLAIAKELVELMGGAIGAESDQRGSTFTFTLPLRPALPATKESQVAPSIARMRVLLAEDEPAVRALLERLLRRHGWDVAIAENGRRAVERWEEGGIDVVLMDVKMPEMDGITAARQIRQRETAREKRACIIALTAHARQEDREECLAAGMDGFLTKPMHMDELESAIRRCPH